MARVQKVAPIFAALALVMVAVGCAASPAIPRALRPAVQRMAIVADPAAECSGTIVSPATDLQAAFDTSPAGTTFCFSPGTYALTDHVRPKSYDQLISEVPRAAILTGLDVYDGGIVGSGGPSGQHNVLVQGFVIERFANQWNTFPRSALQAGVDWTIRDNEIAYNAQSGVTVNSGTQLLGNWIHHNGRYGFAGGPLTDLLVERNDVSFNNVARYDPHNDAGGSKIIRSQRVVFRDNHVYDNHGNGLWCDWENFSITYEGNTLERNYLAGIFHEASGDAVIRDNTFRGNGTYAKGRSLWWSADLLLNDSKNTEIYGNTIVAGVHGIGLVDIDRGSNALGLLEIRNVSVHDNTITMPAGGTSGMVRSRSEPHPPANNLVYRNILRHSDGTAAPWIWPSASEARAQLLNSVAGRENVVRP